MSSYLIIDGYNLISKWPKLIKAKQKSIELARSELFNYVQSYCDYSGIKGIIVFDGRGKKRSVDIENLKNAPTVIYSSSNETADTVIESLVYNMDDKKEARVVTDDRVMANLIIGMGASVSSTELFKSEVEASSLSLRRMLRMPVFLLTVSIIWIFFSSQFSAAQSQPKSRIISLTPASTEILFALGLKDSIVGVSSYCNWPSGVREKERVGSFSSPNIEKIIMLKPDLVIMTGMEQAYLKSILSNLGIEYMLVDPSNLKELLSSIKEIGGLTGRAGKAQSLTEDIESVINKIKDAVSKIPAEKRKKVYLEIWHDPIMSAGSNSFVADMIATAGGINITGDLKRSFSKIDPEQIIYRDPDVIILAYMKPGQLIKNRRLGWESISAVLHNRVYSDINPDIILRPGPRVKEGLIELYRRFYGE